MNKSNKAVLFSALLFPGAGHFFLKRYISGAVIACAALVALYLIIADMLERAREIADKILSGEVGLDIATITEQVSQQSASNDSQLLDIAWAVLIISWLTGIADSYRAGRAQDKTLIDN
jgi:hypothetical protein